MNKNEIKAQIMHNFNSGVTLAREALALDKEPDFEFIETVKKLSEELKSVENFFECFFCKITLSEKNDNFFTLHPMALEKSGKGIKTPLRITPNKTLVTCSKCGLGIVEFITETTSETEED